MNKISILVSTSLIIIGAIIMVMGIFQTSRLIKIIPESPYSLTWKRLKLFMIFFFLGYLAALICLVYGLTQYVLPLTGVIFLFGALFVYLVATTGKSTISDLKSTMLSKEEKEIMLKEIHHRVKNNMQIVSSLLRLQSHKIDDPKTQDIFEECQNRIAAMALIHEKLYESNDISFVDFRKYVEDLVQNLIDSYELETKVSLDLDINVKLFGLDTLIPLGLIINELVSNSLKHAYRGAETGQITIRVNSLANDKYQMMIGDNGIGLSENTLEMDHTTLGLDLVKMLIAQLDGNIEVLKGIGTLYEINFTERKSRQEEAFSNKKRRRKRNLDTREPKDNS